MERATICLFAFMNKLALGYTRYLTTKLNSCGLVSTLVYYGSLEVLSYVFAKCVDAYGWLTEKSSWSSSLVMPNVNMLTIQRKLGTEKRSFRRERTNNRTTLNHPRKLSQVWRC